MSIYMQVSWLFILALPIACIAWTMTQEEIFREPREYCSRCSQGGSTYIKRKFFYVFTCEYCLSHYVTIFILFITNFKLLFEDWRGFLISGFALVWIANIYMNLYKLIRQDIKKVKTTIKTMEEKP
jgi:hypothetical protein